MADTRKSNTRLDAMADFFRFHHMDVYDVQLCVELDGDGHQPPLAQGAFEVGSFNMPAQGAVAALH